MKKNSSLRIKRDKIGQLINVRGEVQVSHTFCVCHVRTTKFTLILLIKCQPKCVTYVWRKVIPFAFIIILDLFNIPTKTSVINTISPVIRDDYMHWPYCSDFQRFLFFSSYFSYRVSLSVHSLSGWYVCHYSTPVSAIRSHLSLGFPLHHITSVSGRCSRRANHISFAVVAAAVSGASLPLPPTLWHASLSASCVILVVAIGSLFLSPLSPPLVIVGWFWTPHRRLILPSSFFSAFVADIRLLRSCALLFPSPPSPPSDHKGPPFVIASFSCLLLPVAIFGRLIRHCLRFGRPRTPFQGFYLDFSPISDLRLGLWRCKYVVSRSLHGVLSRIISPGAALRGPGLGRMPALTYYCLSFSAASLRI